MFGIKIRVTTNTETMKDIKTALRVSRDEFARAYHNQKVRSFEKSLNRLQELNEKK